MNLNAADFAGTWTLSRRITDHAAHQAGSLAGTACLTADGPDRLIYDEEGMFQIGNTTPMLATRRYIWHFEDDVVRMTFANGDPFHVFTPKGLSQGSEHLCGSDIYNVQYQFSDWPKWWARWEVAGPAKDYVMLSNYSRA